MSAEKNIIKLYINYLSKKYDDNISNVKIDTKNYKINNDTYKGVHSFEINLELNYLTRVMFIH